MRLAMRGFGAMLALGASLLQARADCGTPVRARSSDLTAAVPVTMRPSLATDALGGVHVAWRDEDGEVHFAASHDDGATWQPDVDLGSSSAHVAMAVAPDGHVLVVVPVAFGFVASVSADQGRTWTTGDPPWSRSSGVHAPQVALGRDGRAILAWCDPEGDWIEASWSDDWGATWSPACRVNTVALDWIYTYPEGDIASTGSFDVLVTDAGGLVAWTQGLDVLTSLTADGGASFSPPDLTLPASGGEIGHCLQSSDGVHAQIVAVTGTAFDVSVVLRVSETGGTSWLPPTILGPTRSGLGPPSLAASCEGRLAVAWVDDAYASRLQVSDDHGLPGSWLATPGRFAVLGEAAQWHVVTIAPGGEVTIAWADFRDADACGRNCESIYLDRTCDGATFLASDLRLDDALPIDHVSFWPAIASSASGRTHVVFNEEPPHSGTSTIHHRSLDGATRGMGGALQPGPMTVTEAGPDLVLEWEDPGPSTAYNVYAGTLAALIAGTPDHARLACHVPRLAGSPAGRLVVPLPVEPSYWLIGSATCSGDGSLGTDSSGRERAVPAAGPPCGP